MQLCRYTSTAHCLGNRNGELPAVISFPPESVLWGARSSYEVLVDSESVEVLLATGSVLFCKKDCVRTVIL